jgi:AraC-like DNA-binding protein
MQLHEIDGPTRFGQGVRLWRFALDDEVEVCVATYRRTAGRRRRALATRVEVGVQLASALAQRGHRQGAHVYDAGTVHELDQGEAYDLAYAAGDQPGVTVWLSVDERFAGALDEDRELILASPGPRRDPELVELARLLVGEAPPVAAAEVARTLRRNFAARARLSSPSPVIRARRLLERHFASELYLRHIADEVGMHPTTLLRDFARRYGVTPIRYRSRFRLNEAARRAWRAPALPLAQVADSCGFGSAAYFHRQFASYFGTTPARHRQNVPG